jgi:hypothetical protein
MAADPCHIAACRRQELATPPARDVNKAKLGLENLSSIIGGRQKPKKREVKSENLSSIIGRRQNPKKKVKSEKFIIDFWQEAETKKGSEIGKFIINYWRETETMKSEKILSNYHDVCVLRSLRKITTPPVTIEKKRACKLRTSSQRGPNKFSADFVIFDVGIVEKASSAFSYVESIR